MTTPIDYDAVRARLVAQTGADTLDISAVDDLLAKMKAHDTESHVPVREAWQSVRDNPALRSNAPLDDLKTLSTDEPQLVFIMQEQLKLLNTRAEYNESFEPTTRFNILKYGLLGTLVNAEGQRTGLLYTDCFLDPRDRFLPAGVTMMTVPKPQR